jgi:UDP-2,4-diacetamido-2,4,6-trideoxy-beta-L-altropyranose hydrolase
VAPRRDPADLVERLASADLVLLGAGTMKFEAACLGRPMAIVAVADDQLPVGPAFAATGAARYLGDGRTVEPDAVIRVVTELLADHRAMRALAETAASVIDGRGADRVANAVTGMAQPAGSS